MTKPIYIIYKHTCIITGKAYIGQTSQGIDKRWIKHISDAKQYSNLHFHRAIRKHHKDNFTHEILFETTDQNIINEKEIEYITEYDTYKNGYNMTIGGEAMFGINNRMYNKHHSEKSKQKMRFAHLNKKHSKKTKIKMSESATGKNNPNWRGKYYKTPWGIFESARAAAKTCPYKIYHTTIQNWCKNNEIIIVKRMLIKSKYLNSLFESPIGKTFKDLKFGISIQ